MNFNSSAMKRLGGQFLQFATKLPSASGSGAKQYNRNIMTGLRRFNVADGAGGNCKPTPFQQKVLVWTKTYKTIEEIPERITREKMGRAMDKFRVKTCIYMTVGFIITSAVVALLGRRILTKEQKKMTWQTKQEH